MNKKIKILDLKNINKKIQRLIERDGMQCWLCGFDVVLTQISTHPLRPTRDHVIAIKDGGLGLPNNIKLAHAFCNEKRHWEDGESKMFQDYQTKKFMLALADIQ